MIATEVYVRKATRGDRANVLDLIAAMLVELREQGSEVLPTARTIATYARHFDAYLDGEFPGVVIVCDGGFSMAGLSSPEPALDTEFGMVAYGWGTYVEPGRRRTGAATALRAGLRAALARLGFGAVSGALHDLNIQGARSLPAHYKPLYTIGFERLEA